MSDHTTIQMTDEQHKTFMDQQRLHWASMEISAAAQSANSTRVVELLSASVKAPMADRDVFAMAALSGILAGYWSNSDMSGLGPDDLAHAAYEQADAMLEKGGTP